MLGLRKGELIALAIIVVAVVAAGVLHGGSDPGLLAFLAATVALAGLAWLVSFATEQLGERFGPAATGLMQSTLGNLPELFVVFFALKAGQVAVAETAVVGSIFANALLILGLAFVAGGIRANDGVMRFSPRLPNDTATLMLLATSIIVVLGISTASNDRASDNTEAISAIGAVALLVVYLGWAFSYIRGGANADPAHHAAPRVPAAVSVALLAVAGVGAAFVSEWFVGTLEPAIHALGVSEAFAGLVIVAIAGNAIENVVGVVMAAKGQSELAVSVVKNSVAQIAVFVFPVLVLVSMLLDHQLTFALDPVWIGALALTALIVWQVTTDGAVYIWEGLALIAMYVILGGVALYE